ncbi:histone deacetylase 2, putative [Plasmodium vivax]|uniref:histone deacetylase n=1 Tax=Plasmodium vivax TaxID=5855 RepID=A0A564ZVD6_PLAVI|nr:histone deacetylase 2, putative [Plasmodium vivax]
MKNGIISNQSKNENKQTPLKQDTIAHLKLPDKGAYFNNFIIEKFDNINDISLYLRESNNVADGAQQVGGDDVFVVDLIGAVEGGALKNGDLRSSHGRSSSARSSRNGGTPPLRSARNKSGSHDSSNHVSSNHFSSNHVSSNHITSNHISSNRAGGYRSSNNRSLSDRSPSNQSMSNLFPGDRPSGDHPPSELPLEVLTSSNQNGSLSSSYKRRKSEGEGGSPRKPNREAKKFLTNKHHEVGIKAERKRRSKSDINQGDRKKKKKSNEKREFRNAKQGLGIRNNMINKNSSKRRSKLQKGYSVRKKRHLRRGQLSSTSSSNDGEFSANKYILDKIFLSLKKKGSSMEQLNNSFYIEYDESADLDAGGEADTDLELAEGGALGGFSAAASAGVSAAASAGISAGLSAGFSTNVKFSAPGRAARGTVRGAPHGGPSPYADNALEEHYPPEPPKNSLLKKNNYHTHRNTNKAHRTRNANHLYKHLDSKYKEHHPGDLKNGKIFPSPKSGSNNVEYDCIGFVCDEEYMCKNLHFDENHVESPDRIKCIIKALKEKNVINKMVQIKCREALYEEIKECHTSSHINNIFYSLKRKLKYKKKDVIYPFDKHDTYYTSYTGTVSKRAVGGLLNLCDAILSNKNEKFKYIDFKKSFRYNYNFFKNIPPNSVRSFLGNRINHNTHLKRSKSESNLYVMSRFESPDIGSGAVGAVGGGSSGVGVLSSLSSFSGSSKNKQPSNNTAKRGTHKPVSTSNYCYSGNQAPSEPHPSEAPPGEDHPSEVLSTLAERNKEEIAPHTGEASSPQEGANLTEKATPPEKSEAGTELANVIEARPPTSSSTNNPASNPTNAPTSNPTNTPSNNPTSNPPNREEVPIFNKPFRSYSTSMCSVKECSTSSNSFTDINCGFAAIRPPGHHCSRNSPSGFCIFNNISVACKYIFKKYGIRKIFIFDWDVHHDNGTQEIFYSDKDVLCFSIHRFDKKKDDGKKKKGEGAANKGASTATGGGATNGEKGKKKDGSDDSGKNSKGRKGENNKGSSKTFKAYTKGASILGPALSTTEGALSTTVDTKKTAAISSDSSNRTASNATHSDDTKKKKKKKRKKKRTKEKKKLKSYEENLFYPRTGAKSELGSKSGYKFNINVPLEKGYNNCDVYYVFKYLLLPVLENFQPEFIFISCGFDASINDPLGECNLTHNFYQWMTLQLKNFANIFCKGRIILVLEGGYNLNYLPKCTLACIKALIKKNKNRKKEYPLMQDWQCTGKLPTEGGMPTKEGGLSMGTSPNGVPSMKEALPKGNHISEPNGLLNKEELTPSNDSAFRKMQNWRQVKHGSLINSNHKDNDHVNFYKFKCYSDYYKTSNKHLKHLAGKTYTSNMTSKKKELITTGKLHYSTYKVIKYFLCILKGDPFHLNIKLPPYNSFLKKKGLENKKLSLERKISIFKKVDTRADHLRRDGGSYYPHYGEGPYQNDLHRGGNAGSPGDAPYDEDDGGIMNCHVKEKIEQLNRYNQTYKKQYSLSSTTISNLSHSDLYISNDELDYNSSSSDSSRSSKRKVILLNKLKLKISKHGNVSSAPAASRPMPKMEKRRKRQKQKRRQKQKQKQKHKQLQQQRKTFSIFSGNNQEFKGIEIWDLTKIPEEDDIIHVSDHNSSEGAGRAATTCGKGGGTTPNLSLTQCPPLQSDHQDAHLGFDLTNLKYCQDQLQNSFTMYTQRKKGFIFFYGSGHRNQWILPAHKKITRIIKLCSDLEAYFYAWLYLCCGKEMCISGTMDDYASILEDEVTVEGVSLSVDLSEEQKRQAKEFLKFTVPCYYSFLKRKQLLQLGYQEGAPQGVEVVHMKERLKDSSPKDETEGNHNWKEQTIDDGLHEKEKGKSNHDDSSKENSKKSEVTLNFGEHCTSQNVDRKSEGSNFLYEQNEEEKKNAMEQKRSDSVNDNPSNTKQTDESLLKNEKNKTAICLANVLSTMRHPCVMDVKMGVRLYGDDCDADSIQKKIQKAKSRSCLSHGFHLTSVIGWDKKKEEPFFISKEDAHSIKNDDAFVDAFMSFFLACDNVHLSKLLLKKLLLILEHMKAFFESQQLFAFYGTSLLFVFDSDPSKDKGDGGGSADVAANPTGDVAANPTGDVTANPTGDVAANPADDVAANPTDDVTKLTALNSASLAVDPDEERSNEREKEDHEDIFNFREKMQSIFEESLTPEERDTYMQTKLNCKILKSANVYIIDFAHASLNRNQIDEGFLLGITSLHRIMKKTIEKIQTLYLP